MELWLIKSDKKYNITPITTSLEWTTDIDMLGSQLDFTIMQNKSDKYIKDLDIVSGDNIGLLDENGKVLFRGVIVTVDNGDCSCLDYAFYFAQNEETIQFNKVSVSKAIETLCTRYGIESKVGNIRVNVNKIYFDTTIAEMIKDMLENVYKSTGIKYRAYMNKNVLTIDTLYDYQLEGLTVIHELSYKESLEGLYNSIKVVSGSEENYKVEAYVKNDESIAKYGLLQLVEKIDEKDISKAKHTAQTLLKDKNKLNVSGSVVTNGDSKARAGMQVKNLQNARFTGTYLIKSISHKVKNSLYTMQLKLEVI